MEDFTAVDASYYQGHFEMLTHPVTQQALNHISHLFAPAWLSDVGGEYFGEVEDHGDLKILKQLTKEMGHRNAVKAVEKALISRSREISQVFHLRKEAAWKLLDLMRMYELSFKAELIDVSELED
jgi:hypothetical protein